MKLRKTVLKVARFIALNIPCAVDKKLTWEDISNVADQGHGRTSATRAAIS